MVLDTPEVREALSLMQPIPGYRYAHQVGSSIFLPNAADIDFAVVLDPFHKSQAHSYLLSEGWVDCSAEDYQMSGEWKAYRKGRFNFIITDDPVWAQKFANAAQVAAFLNLTDKESRVKINWIIRDDWSAEAAREVKWEAGRE